MPTTSPRTRSGPRRLSDVAKHLASPTGITSTGWPAVRKTCSEKLGITFDDWQEGAGRLILAKRADGNLAAMVDGVGLSLPRQVGKTYLVGALVFALCVNMPGLLVIWSAHHARTHGETFLAMQGFAERSKVKAHVRQVFTGSGDEEIRFHNTSRILFGARERGFGRGIPGVDVLIFDEAQILSDRALSNMLPTMNTSRFGLQLYIGTPPRPEDMSEVFKRMRAEALAKSLTDGAWIELGADDDADGNDRRQWAKANPSFPSRTPVQSLLRLKRKLTDEDWLREGMGIWDSADVAAGALDLRRWAALEDRAVPPPDAAAVVIDVAPLRDRSSIGVAGAAGGRTLAMVRTAPGMSWVVPAVSELVSKRRIVGPVGLAGPQAASLIPELIDAGIDHEVVTHTQAGQSCAAFQTGITDGSIVHLGQPELDAAVSNATTRWSGDAEVWNRRDHSIDISPLVAVSAAAYRWELNAADAYNVLDSIF